MKKIILNGVIRMKEWSVLIIEDEKSICNFLSTILTNNGYITRTAMTGTEAIQQIKKQVPDMILLDLGLPDMDGTKILEMVRKTSDLPIIVISARGKEEEKVKALDLGADDYLSKPFGTNELLARMRTEVRHSIRKNHIKVNQRPYRHRGLVIDFEKHSIQLDGNYIHLTQNEYKIVTLLAENAGKVLTHSHIIHHIWGFQNGEDNKILRVNMANIRRKFEKNPAEPMYIFTEVGIGYRMPESEA
ncbi:response regulator transcription factor [Clostridium sp. Marseille-P299]|uniref:response regulator transcription factor n=1 Tax=Clostridium sp. Marseille-P299 TaxID=1805477 RepID=UPI00325B7557